MNRIKRLLGRNGFLPAILLVIVATQGLSLWIATSQLSVTRDEPANMAAGLEYWETGSSMRYNVNPPLVKLWATLPLYFRDHIQAPRLSVEYRDSERERHEFTLGTKLMDSLGKEFFRSLVSARRMCIWFAIVGTLGIYALAGLWLNERASVMAASIWAFNPITLGFGPLISCDIPAASIGCWAVYCGVCAYRNPSIGAIAIFGCMLGLAVLTKLTWILAFPLTIVIVVALAVTQGARSTNRKRVVAVSKVAPGLLMAFLFAWLVFTAGYRFQGMFRPLAEYSFVSNLLTGNNKSENRFAHSMMADFPVPIPSPMLMGIDQQWQDFDDPRYCYLAGEWQRGGWYYYYFIALMVKLPLGLILLLVFAMRKLRDYREACWVCMPIIVTCFVLVSLKTNMNEHTRYLWLILPQIIVVASLAFEESNKKWNFGVTALWVWSVFTGIWSFPCGISYFNELATGMRGGHQVLAGSNVDWGHGWITARQWLERNVTQHPVVVIPSFRDNLSIYGFQTSAQAPTHIEDPNPMVNVLIAVDERLNLQRDRDFPGPGHSMMNLAGCCVEVYEMHLHELQQLNWHWVVGIGDKPPSTSNRVTPRSR
ncbi:MAG: glycosyltransferase family 39 protein [Pirellula sp.]